MLLKSQNVLRFKFRLAAFVVFFSVPVLGLDLELPGACEVTFSGSSLLSDFSGTVTAETFVVTFQESSGSGQGTASVYASLNVADMDTGSGLQNRKMRKMFDWENHPRISGAVTNLNVVAMLRKMTEKSDTLGSQSVSIRIKEEQRTLPAATSNLVVNADGACFDVGFDVSMRDFKLKPPSLVWLVKVLDEVHVEVKVSFEPDGLQSFIRTLRGLGTISQ